jgi:hypothetical protein
MILYGAFQSITDMCIIIYYSSTFTIVINVILFHFTVYCIQCADDLCIWRRYMTIYGFSRHLEKQQLKACMHITDRIYHTRLRTGNILLYPTYKYVIVRYFQGTFTLCNILRYVRGYPGYVPWRELKSRQY